MVPRKPIPFRSITKTEPEEDIVQTPEEAAEVAETGEQEVDIEELPGGGTRETARPSRRYSR